MAARLAARSSGLPEQPQALVRRGSVPLKNRRDPRTRARHSVSFAPRETRHRQFPSSRAGTQHGGVALGRRRGGAARRDARRRVRRAEAERERRAVPRASPARPPRGALRDGRDVRADRRRRAHSPPPLDGDRRRRTSSPSAHACIDEAAARDASARVRARHGRRLRPRRRVVLGARGRSRTRSRARLVTTRPPPSQRGSTPSSIARSRCFAAARRARRSGADDARARDRRSRTISAISRVSSTRGRRRSRPMTPRAVRTARPRRRRAASSTRSCCAGDLNKELMAL